MCVCVYIYIYKLHITLRHTFYEIMECQYSVKLEKQFCMVMKTKKLLKISNYSNFYQNTLKKLNIL